MKRALLWALVIVACKSTPKRADLGPVAHPSGLLARVEIGESCDAAKKAVPELQGNPPSLHASDPQTSYSLECADGRVDSIQTMWRNRSPSELREKWGDGVTSAVGRQRLYLDRSAHLRTTVEDLGSDSFEVRIRGYTPLVDLLGKDPTSVAGMKIFGRSAQDIADEMKAKGMHVVSSPGAIAFGLARSEWSNASDTPGTVLMEGQPTASAWSIQAITADWIESESSRAGVLAAFEAAWGKPTSEDDHELVYGGHPRITVDKKSLVFVVRP